MATITKVYDHPHLQECLELALRLRPRHGEGDAGMNDAQQFNIQDTKQMGTEKHEHAFKGSIPGLTLNSEDTE